MIINKRLYAVIPFITALVTVAACFQGGSDSPSERVGAASAAAACGVPLDDFTKLPTWNVLPLDDGHPDITEILQTAVTALATATGSHTIFIRAGTWTINKTITVRGANYAAIVGADPATTKIHWAGGSTFTPTNGYPDMFRVFDLTSLNISRLTLDGNPNNDVNHQARMGIHLFQSECYNAGIAYHDAITNPLHVYDTNPALHHRCEMTQAQMDATGVPAVTGFAVTDDVFQHLEFGLVGGAYAMTAGILDFSVGLVDSRTGVAQGISGSNVGDVVVRRSRFDTISTIGVSAEGSNVFNWLVADSEFTHNFRGIQVSQSGGVHVINNHFQSNGFMTWTNKYAATAPSTDGMDIYFNGYVGTVIRGNFSEDSQQFLVFTPFGQLSAADVSGNYIRTLYNAAYPIVAPITLQGTQITLFDNFIQLENFPAATSIPTSSYGVFSNGYGTWGYLENEPRITDGNNTFVTSDPNSTCTSTCDGAGCKFFRKDGSSHTLSPPRPAPIGGLPPAPGTLQEIVVESNHCLAPTAVTPAPCSSASAPLFAAACAAFTSAVTPVVAPDLTRPVDIVSTIAPACTNVPGTGCADQINAWLVTQKAKVPAIKPFLFFSAGVYYIDKTIEVPANLDVTLGGDGVKSQLTWQRKLPGVDSYVFHLNSPSQATVRDLSVYVDNDLAVTHDMTYAGGILVDSPDDPGGVVWLDTVSASYAQSMVDVLGLDNVAVRADMSGGGQLQRAFGVTGGGKASPSGGGSTKTQGLLMVAGGSSSLSGYADVKNWGKAVLIAVDNEGATQGMDLAQSGYLTFATGRFISQKQRFAGYADQPNAIVHSTFRGRLTLMNLTSMEAVLFAAASTPGAQVLGLDNWYSDDGTLGAGQPVVTLPCTAVGTSTSCAFVTKLNPLAVATPTPTQMEVQGGTKCLLTPAHLDPDGGADAGMIPDVFDVNYCDNNKPTAVTDSATGGFIKAMLEDERAARMAPPQACSSTAVRIHRVAFQGTPFTATNTTSFMGPAVRVQRF